MAGPKSSTLSFLLPPTPHKRVASHPSSNDNDTEGHSRMACLSRTVSEAKANSNWIQQRASRNTHMRWNAGA